MTDISALVGGPDRAHRTSGGQRARVVKPPASLSAPLTVSLLAYTNEYEYEVPGTNWVSRGTALPIKGTVGVAVFDDFGDTWFLVGGGTEFPAGGGGGTETDPIASAALTAHAADTTAIHGIADTSLLVVTSDPRLANARAPTAHHTTHEPGGTDAMAVDAAAATGSLRTLGTSATSAAAGNDARLSDARTPAGVIAGDLAGSTWPTLNIAAGVIVNADVNAAAAIARSKLDFGTGLVNADIAAAAGITKTKLANLDIVNADVNAAAAIAEAKLNLATDAAAGTGSRRTLGTGALQAAAGNDARFTDARIPTAHKTSHETGGGDALTGNLDAVGRTNVKKAGTVIGTRRGLNLIEGTNVTLTVADDAANEEVDVTIAAAGGGGGSVFYDDLQQGVVAAGDCALTRNSATQVTIAAGTVYVTASGVLVRSAPGSTVLSAIPAASATNFRLDQVVVSSTGIISRLQGTQGTTVTMTNRTGAAAIPAGSLLLHDMLIDSTGLPATAANLRDRRMWALGAFRQIIRATNAAAGSNYTTASTTYVEIDTTNLKPRIECSGAPVRCTLSTTLENATAVNAGLDLFIDGATANRQRPLFIAAGADVIVGATFELVPAAGSHLFSPAWKTSAGTLIAYAQAVANLTFTVEEIVRQNAVNG